MLGGGTHTDDGGARANGARTSAPTRRRRPRAASMSSQGPWLRISSALYKEFRASARPKPKGVPLGTLRGDRLALHQGGPVADGSILHAAVGVMHQAREISPPDVSAARRPSPGRPGPVRCTGSWRSASR